MGGSKEEIKAKEKLKSFVKDEITKLFSSVLDYAEVAVDGKERYGNLRSKILKVSNDVIRELHREIDRRYTVTCVPLAEEVIVVNQKK